MRRKKCIAMDLVISRVITISVRGLISTMRLAVSEPFPYTLLHRRSSLRCLLNRWIICITRRVAICSRRVRRWVIVDLNWWHIAGHLLIKVVMHYIPASCFRPSSIMSSSPLSLPLPNCRGTFRLPSTSTGKASYSAQPKLSHRQKPTFFSKQNQENPWHSSSEIPFQHRVSASNS